MKKALLQLSAMAFLVAGPAVMPLMAQDDEGKAAVPSQANPNDPSSTVYRASDVMNMPVKDDGGNEVGRIKDLVINGQSREVLYAVVAMNAAKDKDSLYVMPWTVFQPSYGQNNMIQYATLGLAQNVWMQAPFFTAAQWRQANYAQWGPRVNNYYAGHVRGGEGANINASERDRNTANAEKRDAAAKEKSEESTANKEKAAAANKAESTAKKDEKAYNKVEKVTTLSPDKNPKAPVAKNPEPKAPNVEPGAKEPAPKEPAPKEPAPKGPAPAKKP